MPKYDGVIEQWKVDLIIDRAKFLGFQDNDIPDVLQEVVPELLNFTYDPHHAAGAKEQTVLTYVVDNHLHKIKRFDNCYRSYVEQMGEEASEFSRPEVEALAIDVANAVTGLTDFEQTICRSLADGMTKEQIADELGCSWHTVNRAVVRVREYFDLIGLGGWIGL